MRAPTERLTPDLMIIGAGSGGLSVAAGAVQMGATVGLLGRRDDRLGRHAAVVEAVAAHLALLGE
ncbi:MAG: hypothetical protein AAFV96_10140, partial [Pseudomonadota bacterium]